MVKERRLKALRLGIRAIRISEQSLNKFTESNIVDPDEYFGFEETRDTDLAHSMKIVRPTWMEK